MTVIVDATVWSLALRRRSPALARDDQRLVMQWRELVADDRGVLIGAIRQEVLSGVRDEAVFERVRGQLDHVTCLAVEIDDYDRAAEFFNACQARGVASTAIDMLICAVAARVDAPILTTDRDFERYASLLPIALYDVRE